MNISDEKAQKLVDIARLYYERDLTQGEIAKKYSISRPLVSRLLGEARNAGIVKIEIRSPLEGNNLLLNQIRNIYEIKGGRAVPSGANDSITNHSVAKAAIEYMTTLHAEHYGIGWGSIIGELVSLMDSGDVLRNLAKSVCPLVGNSNVFNRNYHSNEIVRIFAKQTQSIPYYWYAPAFVDSEQEMMRLKGLESYDAVSKAWSHMDAAIVNIGNYPSVPDFATVARFSDKLTSSKAVGRLLCYYFTLDGQIIRSDTDYSLQVPLDSLAKTKDIIGICSANVKPKALAGALRTGIFTHLVAPEKLIQDTLQI